MLEPYRVLDLSDERGQLAGHILAALGADVIAVEPPGGSHSRQVGPFVGDRPGPDGSLWHWSYNRGKRSVVLDLHDAAGRDRFLDLVATADVVIESWEPGRLDALGLGYATLAGVNPGVVVVSVTAFGQDGPKAHWAASDLTVEASSCELWLTGDRDRPPVRVSIPQGYLNGALDAACGALVALFERKATGAGQHVDASAQESCALITQGQVLSAPYENPTPLSRNGAGLKVGPIELRWVYPAADGHVTITVLFGPVMPYTQRLIDLMAADGVLPDDLAALDWADAITAVLMGELPVDTLDRLQDAIAAYTVRRTKAELMGLSLAHRLLIAPVSTIPELIDSAQLVARGYWEPVDHPGLGAPVAHPGAVVRASATPLAPLGRPPALGEHTDEVLSATPPRPAAAPAPPGPAGAPAPLGGIKVVDLTWFMAGPMSTRMLADWGATVVRVESVRRPDGGRGSGPFWKGVATPDSGGYPLSFSAGKLGLALDLTRPEARPVFDDLVRWADVVVVNFSPRATRNLGLDHATLSAVNPGVITVSTCLMGYSGPFSEFAGFGNLSSAYAGFYEVGGWPDRPPIGPFLAYTDVVAPRFTFCSILAALEARARTGAGQHLDLSQAETAIQLLAPAVLDYQVNARVAGRHGNSDPAMAPHGVYPTAGEDRWVAIACTGDDQWQRLCAAMARRDLAADASLATLAGRLARRDELDGIVAGWTARLRADDVEATLQACGVAAHRVADSDDCWADPQLAHRGHFLEVDHPHHGRIIVQGPRLRLSRSQCSTTRAAPPIGEDTDRVLRDLLGYDDDRITELALAEVLE